MLVKRGFIGFKSFLGSGKVSDNLRVKVENRVYVVELREKIEQTFRAEDYLDIVGVVVHVNVSHSLEKSVLLLFDAVFLVLDVGSFLINGLVQLVYLTLGKSFHLVVVFYNLVKLRDGVPRTCLVILYVCKSV